VGQKTIQNTRLNIPSIVMSQAFFPEQIILRKCWKLINLLRLRNMVLRPASDAKGGSKAFNTRSTIYCVFHSVFTERNKTMQILFAVFMAYLTAL
jgi:hypothetical protein